MTVASLQIELAATAVAQVYNEGILLATLGSPDANDPNWPLSTVHDRVLGSPYWPTFVAAVVGGWAPAEGWLRYPHCDVVLGWARGRAAE